MTTELSGLILATLRSETLSPFIVDDSGSERLSDLSMVTQLGEAPGHISNPGQPDVEDVALNSLILYPWMSYLTWVPPFHHE